MGAIIPQVITEDRAGASISIDGSLRFDSSKSHYLTRTPTSVGNRKTWTWSGWVKRSALSGLNESFIFNAGFSTDDSRLQFNPSDNLSFKLYQSASTVADLTSTSVYRDFSSWYHITLVVDTPQSVSTDRVKIYVNGSQLILSGTYPTQNLDTSFNTAQPHTIGSRALGGSYFFNGQLTNVYFIDGQALGPEYFGYTDPLTNTWRPKRFKPQATPNNGTTWSSAGNFSGDVRSQGDTYGPPKMFNGIIGNESTTDAICFAPYTSNSFCTWTSPATLTGLTSLRLYVDLSGTTGRLTVNGVDYSSLVTALSGGDGWISIPQSSLSTIGFGYTGGLVSATGIGAVEVNGVILLDGDTTNIGKNGFYLPFDGNSQIGQDRSGNVGIAWTAVNFGGSNTIEKATGALPILNTDGGGKVVRVGVRTDPTVVGVASTCLVLALPLVGASSDFSNLIDGRSSNKVITNSNVSFSSTISNFYGSCAVFNGSSGKLTTTATSDFLFGTGDFTVEGWFYQTADTTYSSVLEIGNHVSAGSDGILFIVRTSGVACIYSNAFYGSAPVPLNSWTHIAWTRISGVLKIYVNGILSSSTTFTNNLTSTTGGITMGTTHSLSPTGYWYPGFMQDFRIYKGVAKYTQNFIPASIDPDILPDTPSGLPYSSNLALVPSTDGAVSFTGIAGTYLSAPKSADFDFGTGDFTLEAFVYLNSTGTILSNVDNGNLTSGGFYIAEDGSTNVATSAGSFSTLGTFSYPIGRWFHIAVTRSGTTARGFIDGVQQFSVTNSTNIGTSGTNEFSIGSRRTGSGGVGPYGVASNGFISNVHVVKGTALYTSNFTPPTVGITTVANTKLLCCKSQISATAFDVSPGIITAFGNTAASNFNPFTVNINTQRGKQSGYATLSPIRGYSQTLSNGNLTGQTAGGWVGSTIDVSSGKYYVEFTPTVNTIQMFGICSSEHTSNAYPWQTAASKDVTYYVSDGRIYVTAVNTGTTTAAVVGDTISFTFDTDTREVKIYKNGILLSTKTILQSSSYMFYLSDGGGVSSANVNFGQKPFKFPPPAGFQPLTLANTPRPTITRPDQYVGIVTYTGNGGTQNINVGFKPDFVWIKNRTDASTNNSLFDSVRGAGISTANSRRLSSDNTSSEWTSGDQYGYLSSFDTYGFSVSKGTTTPDNTNGNTKNYVAWAWKAGGNSNTFNINDVGYATASAAGLTAGTITPTGASVNTKSGFSIITYSGSASAGTISHGLGISPSMIFVKERNNSRNWFVWHTSLGATQVIEGLNTTSAATTQAAFGSTLPTSSVFSVGSVVGGTNGSGSTFVAYLWAEIPGFSKFGSYTGNGSADGPVVITGFRPRWILFKQSGAISGWAVFDAARNPYNLSNLKLQTHTASGESVDTSTNSPVDILSNGFKLRGSGSDGNASAGTYIYAAFAEAPSFNLYGGQANAR